LAEIGLVELEAEGTVGAGDGAALMVLGGEIFIPYLNAQVCEVELTFDSCYFSVDRVDILHIVTFKIF